MHIDNGPSCCSGVFKRSFASGCYEVFLRKAESWLAFLRGKGELNSFLRAHSVTVRFFRAGESLTRIVYGKSLLRTKLLISSPCIRCLSGTLASCLRNSVTKPDFLRLSSASISLNEQVIQTGKYCSLFRNSSSFVSSGLAVFVVNIELSCIFFFCGGRRQHKHESAFNTLEVLHLGG